MLVSLLSYVLNIKLPYSFSPVKQLHSHYTANKVDCNLKVDIQP
jgi:hypothetical protein